MRAQLLRQSEAARRLGVHRITLRQWTLRGILAPVQTRRPGTWYRAADVAALEVGKS